MSADSSSLLIDSTIAFSKLNSDGAGRFLAFALLDDVKFSFCADGVLCIEATQHRAKIQNHLYRFWN